MINTKIWKMPTMTNYQKWQLERFGNVLNCEDQEPEEVEEDNCHNPEQEDIISEYL